MVAFFIRRTAVLLMTLIAATLIIFFAMEMVPGDPALFMMGINADPQAVEALRQDLGLNQPALQRYVTWASGLLVGDFGTSFTYSVPVRDLIVERLVVSLPLAVLALLLATVIAFGVGLLAAARKNSVLDVGIMGLTQFGIAIPNFWFGMILVLVFAVNLQWFSAGGFPGWEAGLLVSFKALVLPALSLALLQAALLARIVRSALIDALDEDYVRTARAKGASETTVLWRHAFRNALLPVLTVIGLQFSFLLAGAIIIENVFYLPGLGRLVFQGITQRDLIVVQSVVVLLVFSVILINFLVDVAYAIIDPRLRRRK